MTSHTTQPPFAPGTQSQPAEPAESAPPPGKTTRAMAERHEALFLALTGTIVLLLSALMLCVGMFAGIVIIMLAQAYVWYQLYALYLTRGGQPIPLKPIVRKPAQPQYRP